MKKYYSIGLTILFFTLITSIISPSVAIEGNAQGKPIKEVEEDFSTPTQKPTSTPVAKGLTRQSASSSAEPTEKPKTVASQKMVVYKGEVSATPSAVGKFLVTTAEGQKNVDTDKSTRVYIFDKGQKTIASVSKIKMGDKSVSIGQVTEDGKALLAKYVLIMRNTPTEKTKNAKYGIVSSREASSSSSFVLQIKSPSKDEKTENYLINAETTVKVKDVENPQLSDIKIGDRVTFTFYVDEKTNQNIITRIFSIPGRAAGLLKDIRDASAAAEKQTADEKSIKSSAKPSATPKR